MIDPIPNLNNYFFSKFKISPELKFSIVIPVKDEAEYILKTLEAFTDQIESSAEILDPNQFELLILANNCSDNSVPIIKQFQTDHPQLNVYLEEVTLPAHKANIGYVRRKLMESAHSRLIKNGGGIIMTTDADTTVSKDWISQIKNEIGHGAEVVGGRIFLYDEEISNLNESSRLHHFKDEKYQLLVAELEGLIISPNFDPLPRHHQHFNGSFAITTDCYAKSGGVPIVDHLEDCAFYDRLQLIDAKIRHSPNVIVHTSARCAGRTQIGLSQQLNEWKNLGKDLKSHQVESCYSITLRLTQKKSLIKLWQSRNNISNSDFFSYLKLIFPKITFESKIFKSFKTSNFFGEWYTQITKLTETQHEQSLLFGSIDVTIKELEEKILYYSNPCLSQISIR